MITRRTLVKGTLAARGQRITGNLLRRGLA